MLYSFGDRDSICSGLVFPPFPTAPYEPRGATTNRGRSQPPPGPLRGSPIGAKENGSKHDRHQTCRRGKRCRIAFSTREESAVRRQTSSFHRIHGLELRT